jgi:hypothetical protein
MQSKGIQAPAAQHDLPGGILILGAAKSGTTALFYAIRKALSATYGLPVDGLFEPRHVEEVSEYLSSTSDRVHLVKGLLGPLLRHDGRSLKILESKFDKKILIYRDPRDNIVSRICFMLKNRVGGDQKKIGRVLEMFREKEASPGSISIVGLVRRMSEIIESPEADLLASVRDNALLPAKMKRELGDAYFFMPYDELVSEQFDGLSNYLGLTVTADFEVDRQHSFVVRSKSSGAWKDWFLDEDVQFFVREHADEFRLLGFDPEESANVERRIDPKTSSEYVAAQFQHTLERRTQSRARKRERARAAEAEKVVAAPPRQAASPKPAPPVPVARPERAPDSSRRERQKLGIAERKQRRERRRSRQEVGAQ